MNSLHVPDDVLKRFSPSLKRALKILLGDTPMFTWSETDKFTLSDSYIIPGNDEASRNFNGLLKAIVSNLNGEMSGRQQESGHEKLKRGFGVSEESVIMNAFYAILFSVQEVKTLRENYIKEDIKHAKEVHGGISFNNFNRVREILKELSAHISKRIHGSLMNVFRNMLENSAEAMKAAGLPELSVLAGAGDEFTDEIISDFLQHRGGLWMIAADRAGGADRIAVSVRRCEAVKAFPSLFPIIQSGSTDNIPFHAVLDAVDNGKPYTKMLQASLHLPRSSFKGLFGFRIYPHTLLLNNGKTISAACSMFRWNLPSHLYPKTAEEWEITPYLNGNYVNSHYKCGSLRPDILADAMTLPKDERITAGGNSVQCSGWSSDLNDGLRELQNRVHAVVRRELMQRNPILFYEDKHNTGIRPDSWAVFLEFVCAGRSPKRIVELLWKLHRDVAELACVDQEFSTGISRWPELVPVREVAGYKAVPLTTASELILEGRNMHHCVGTYAQACLEGSSHIYSFRKTAENGDETPFATVEVRCNRQAETSDEYISSLTIAQVRGPWNAPIKKDPQTMEAIKKWISDIRIGKRPKMLEEQRKMHQQACVVATQKQSSPDKEDKERDIRRFEISFPIFREFLPDARGKNIHEWIAQSGVLEFMEERLLPEKIPASERISGVLKVSAPAP